MMLINILNKGFEMSYCKNICLVLFNQVFPNLFLPMESFLASNTS